MIDKCPKCGASNEAEAEDDRMCVHNNTCPMLCAYEWEDALAKLNEAAGNTADTTNKNNPSDEPIEGQQQGVSLAALREDVDVKPSPSSYHKDYYLANREKLLSYGAKRRMAIREVQRMIADGRASELTPEQLDVLGKSRGRPKLRKEEVHYEVINMYHLTDPASGELKFIMARGNYGHLVQGTFASESEALAFVPTMDYLSIREVITHTKGDKKTRHYTHLWYSLVGLWHPVGTLEPSTEVETSPK